MFKPELLHIIDWNLLELSVKEDPDEKSGDYEYNLDNQVEFGFNPENKIIRAQLDITITKSSETDKQSSARAHVQVEFFYLVDNFDELHTEDENEVLQVDQGLMANLSGISFSTTRGLILQRFKDTSFERFILPIVSVADDIKTNAKP